jgi:hypothetical protein
MKSVVFMVVFFSSCLAGQAQPADSIAKSAKFYHIFNLEAGTGLLRIYTQASYALQQNNLFLKVKASAQGKNAAFGSALPKYEDVSFLFGTVFSVTKKHHFSIGAGMSYLYTNTNHEIGGGGIQPILYTMPSSQVYNQDSNYQGIAFPVELKFNFLQGKHMGMGTSLSADVNNKYAFYGISVGLIFGRLK